MALSKIPAGVRPQVFKICDEVVDNNPQVTHVYGYHTIPDHVNRRCIDYMIRDIADGDKVVKYHLDNRKRLLVDLIIWNRRIMRSYPKPGIAPWTWAKYTGKDPHTNHPHVQYKEGIYIPPLGGAPVMKESAKVKVGDTALVLAIGELNGREHPSGAAAVATTRPHGSAFEVSAVSGTWAQERGGERAWYSTDFLFPQVKPDPKNAAGISKGDKVSVTASGGLRGRLLPGGPLSTHKGNLVITRPVGYIFKVTQDVVSGWASGGSNWYSTDYLVKE